MKQGSGFETIEVTLDRPMGLQLNSGREGIGAYVAGIVPDGNAAKAGTVRVGDVMVSCADGVDTRGVDFDDIMDALAANPDAPTMKLTFKRWPDTPNKTSPEGYVWLEANARREDVVVLPSGLQYRVLEEERDRRAASPRTRRVRATTRVSSSTEPCSTRPSSGVSPSPSPRSRSSGAGPRPWG